MGFLEKVKREGQIKFSRKVLCIADGYTLLRYISIEYLLSIFFAKFFNLRYWIEEKQQHCKKYLNRLKSPNRTDTVGDTLADAPPAAKVEILKPGTVIVDLQGTPVEDTGETANNSFLKIQ
jgi:hypothetical protein